MAEVPEDADAPDANDEDDGDGGDGEARPPGAQRPSTQVRPVSQSALSLQRAEGRQDAVTQANPHTQAPSVARARRLDRAKGSQLFMFPMEAVPGGLCPDCGEAAGGTTCKRCGIATVPSVLDNRYELRRPLGRGGMATVWEARQLSTGRAVAVKLMTGDHPDLRIRFVREAQMCARLEHPNVVRVYDSGFTPQQQPYLVMEMLRGHDLLRDIRDRTVLPWEEALRILVSMMEGLHAAHAAGMIHRDIKPANVFLHAPRVGPRTVKLMDFGVAFLALADEKERLTRPGHVVGTPLYMSPEQLTDATLDDRTDLYSSGLVLFEMLTGAHPFGGGRTVQMLVRQVEEPPPRLHALRPDLAHVGGLQALLDGLLAKKAADRFPNAADVATAARSILGGTQASAPVLEPVPRVAVVATPSPMDEPPTLDGRARAAPAPAVDAAAPEPSTPTAPLGLHHAPTPSETTAPAADASGFTSVHSELTARQAPPPAASSSAEEQTAPMRGAPTVTALTRTGPALWRSVVPAWLLGGFICGALGSAWWWWRAVPVAQDSSASATEPAATRPPGHSPAVPAATTTAPVKPAAPLDRAAATATPPAPAPPARAASSSSPSPVGPPRVAPLRRERPAAVPRDPPSDTRPNTPAAKRTKPAPAPAPTLAPLEL